MERGPAWVRYRVGQNVSWSSASRFTRPLTVQVGEPAGDENEHAESGMMTTVEVRR